MDRYHQNTSNSSPGFVYFNTSQEYPNKSDTNDFLAFNDTPQASPQTNRFKPAYYSSPQSKFNKRSPRNYPQSNRKYQRWSGGNRSYNSSYNSSFNQSSSVQDDDQEPEIARFIHPSFLEDPWAPLEARLKHQIIQNNGDDSIQAETTS